MPRQHLSDRRVAFGKREEGEVAQTTEDIRLGKPHSGLDFGLVARFARSGWENADRIMRRHARVGAVDLRVVERRLVDARLEIIGDHEPGPALEKRKHMDVRADPIGQRLAPARLDIGVVGGAEHSDEELRRADLASNPVDDRHRLAGVVDEHLVAGDMVLAHRR
jgi:hypothetical protein